MSTSDPNEHGPLTRKQLREIRLTGSTPVITAEEAAAAAKSSAATPVASAPVATEQKTENPRHESMTTDHEPVDASGAPLTRRQARAQERVRTGSVPVTDAEPAEAEQEAIDAETVEAETVDTETVPADELVDESDEPIELEVIASEPESDAATIVDGVPEFARHSPEEDDDEGVDDVETVQPVSAVAAKADATQDDTEQNDAEQNDAERDDTVAGDRVAEEATDDERPVVNPAFGVGVLNDPVEAPQPFTPSFDELLTVGDSTGSQHLAPSALIFTPSPGEGSLSGPVASTGEILVTGSYELPRGMGSQGHAHGTTDGKDVDAVLIDGELAPSSSPTPIAASSAVSTIKPAGEVIRPPAPDKGNKLMLILAITAGGLALALGVVLIFAFTTNVF